MIRVGVAEKDAVLVVGQAWVQLLLHETGRIELALMIFKRGRLRLLDVAAIDLVLLVVMLMSELDFCSRTQERINAGQHDVAASLPPNKRRGGGSRGRHHLIQKRARRCCVWRERSRWRVDVILKRLQAAVAVVVHGIGSTVGACDERRRKNA